MNGADDLNRKLEPNVVGGRADHDVATTILEDL
jgi:hypothetical protein